DAGARVHLHRGRELGREILDADADPRALHVTVLHDLLGGATREVRRDREADAGAPTDDHRVDGEDATVEIAERAARVSRVDARVGLQVVLDLVHAETTAALRAEDARRDRVREGERRADRDDPLADAGVVGI